MADNFDELVKRGGLQPLNQAAPTQAFGFKSPQASTEQPETTLNDRIFAQLGPLPEAADISLSEMLKKKIADLAYPISNAALGATLTPGGGVAKTIGGVLGLVNNENPFTNLTNIGLGSYAGASKLLPGAKEATKQAIATAIPATVNIARSDDKEAAIYAGLTGLATQTALGAGADIKNKFGQRGAVRDVNENVTAIKKTMQPRAGNKDARTALQQFDSIPPASIRLNPTAQPQVFQQHPEVLEDILNLRKNTPVAKQREIAANPIRELAREQLDSYLSGSNTKKDFDKSIPLAKLKTYREAFPDSSEIEQAYVSRIFKDIRLSEVITGKANPETIQKTLKLTKLDPEASKVIFGDLKTAHAFNDAISKLPDALHKASATISPADIGSTVGATGVRLGIMGALIDPHAWVNIFTKKEFSDKQKSVIRALDLINDPAKIKKLETDLGRTGVASSLLRSIALTLADANTTQQRQDKQLAVTPQAAKQANDLQRTQP